MQSLVAVCGSQRSTRLNLEVLLKLVADRNNSIDKATFGGKGPKINTGLAIFGRFTG